MPGDRLMGPDNSLRFHAFWRSHAYSHDRCFRYFFSCGPDAGGNADGQDAHLVGTCRVLRRDPPSLPKLRPEVPDERAYRGGQRGARRAFHEAEIVTQESLFM